MFALVIIRSGVNEDVVIRDTAEPLLDKVARWEPDVRLGRVEWQDYGYKRGVVVRGGVRAYELFETT
jgi:hypothetical protein